MRIGNPLILRIIQANFTLESRNFGEPFSFYSQIMEATILLFLQPWRTDYKLEALAFGEHSFRVIV